MDRAALGTVAKVRSGFAFKSRDWQSSGVPVVKIANVKDGFVVLDGCSFVSEDVAKGAADYYLFPGDILISMTGYIGEVARVRDEGRMLLNQRVGKFTIKTPDLLDSGYLYHCLRDPELKARFVAHAYGAAQPNISPTLIEQQEIALPPLLVQKRIAGILSAYDDLIENCQRRIQILESMASALYREWFVHFRFPGHEGHRRIASPLGEIPEGWEVTTVGNHLSDLESGKRPKGGVRDVDDGVPSIGAENINGIGRHDYSAEKFVSREFYQSMRRGVVRDRDVAIYKDGAYIGKSSYLRDGFPHVECCVNEHVFLLRSRAGKLTQNALYLWLQEPDTVHAIRATNANAAQPGINQQSVRGLELVIPDEETARCFDGLVEPLLAQIVNHAKRIHSLRRTRDLLLPRLLSGQIDVGAA